MKRANKNDPVSQRILWTYRILGIVAATMIVAIAYLIPPKNVVDPLWERFALSTIILAVTAASFVSPLVRRRYDYFVYALSFLINVWLISLAFRNNLILEYSPTPLIVIAVGSFVFKHFRAMLLWMGATLAFTLAAFNLADDPVFNPWYFTMIEVIIIVGMGVLMDRQINSQRNLRRQEARRRVITESAFQFSGDGILVVSPEGKVLEFNSRFLEMWQLANINQSDNPEDTILPHLQRQLKDPAAFDDISEKSYRFPDSSLSQDLALIDGRFLYRFSHPLHFEGVHVGRIWFYRDVTRERLEQQGEKEKRRLLQAENRALFELATTIEAQEGNRRQKLSEIATRGLDVLQVRSAGIWLRNAGGDRFHGLFAVGADKWNLTDSHIVIREHPDFQKALASHRVFALDETGTAPELEPLKTAHPIFRGAACLFVPLRQNGKLGGFIYIRDHSVARRWNKEEISFAGSLGDIGGIVLESTRRREAEQKLQEKLAVLQSVFEMSGMGILVTALDGRTLDYNADFQEIWRLNDEQAQPGNEAAALERMQSLLANPFQGEQALAYLRSNPDGERFDLYRLNDGRIIERNTKALHVGDSVEGRIWFFRDITARMQGEEALRISELQNRAIVDAVPDLMIRMDVTGYVLNLKVPETGAYREWLPPEIETIETVFPQHFVAEILDMSLLAMDSGEIQEIESQLVLERKLRDLEVRVKRSGQGEVLVMVRDVTQRKAAERELIQRNFELDSFVYRASHDLKAPLNSLMGLIDILLRETIPVEIVTYIQMMDRSVVKLDTFIRNLNEFSRITRLDLVAGSVDFPRLFHDIRESLLYMEEAKEVDMQLEVQGEKEFLCDRFHLEVILSNLISNAIKYKDRHKTRNWVRLKVAIYPHEAVIKVSDNGIGIPEEYQDRLFELFFRASNQSFGSGLGLYITQNAVKKIGGKIHLQSQEGEGTTFQLTIPQARVTQKA